MKKMSENKKQDLAKENKVDKIFNELDAIYTNHNLSLMALLVFISYFGIMGIIWMIPFPQFDFLVKMNAHTFLNWGSFFIAIIIYLYLKLAPTLSYAVLLCISIISFFIVQLEYVEKDGGPAVIIVSIVLALIGLLGLFFYIRKSGSKLDTKSFSKLIGYGPIWLWSKLFKKFNIKY